MPHIFPPIYLDPNLDKKHFNPNRLNAEKLIYDSLLNHLDDEYYVFHSYRWQSSFKNKYKNGENDFMVFHPKKGILIIEVKGGEMIYKEGSFYRLLHGEEHILAGAKDPLNQVMDAKAAMLRIFQDHFESNFIEMPITFALWFPNSQFDQVNRHLPFKSIQLFDQKTLTSPQKAIESIFEDEKIEMKLSKKQVLDVLLPALNIVSSLKSNQDRLEQKMMMLTETQSRILDFTEYEPYAAIRGKAGSGKTVVAEQKVRRLASQYPNEKILFLCFNSGLQHYLNNKYSEEERQFISVLTYDQLAKRALESSFVKRNATNWSAIREKFYETLIDDIDAFEYQHIIIDEAQDFEEEWIELLQATTPKHLYLFYDQNQDIYLSKSETPSWLLDIDCRLSLNINCRNTKEIANYSNRFINKERNKHRIQTLEEVESGIKPQTVFIQSIEEVHEFIEQKAQEWNTAGIDPQKHAKVVSVHSSHDVDQEYSAIVPQLQKVKNPSVLKVKKNDTQTANLPYTTASKVKGLEADAVFITDVRLEKYQDPQYLKRMYVASSRAKFELYIFVWDTDKETMKNALQTIGTPVGNASTKKQLAKLI
ncbi:NERD domain-containing protein [Flammeovirga sp. SubArs3]|uniref:nuclease-related domain-containing DEAD/DEAH box helicase n=1 Tax=Flammeovirga sp. SubArs3 TaxID=2995316 RepID=UPI00248C4EE3|nr:NERD domain-containing protein [Flammeovirga sp. SubArs3]